MGGNDSECGQPSANSRTVEKLMSTSQAEFHRSLRRLHPGIAIAPGQRRFVVAEGDGEATISLEPVEFAVLGGLMRLERYRVTITFSGLSRMAEDRFVERFDRTFQRGGG